jgi:hypothetical protein
MSILDNNTPGNLIPPATRVANQLVNMTVRSYQQMVDTFNRGSIMFWQNPQGLTPDEIAEALGTNAQEVFQLHYKLGQLIGGVKPEAIAEGLGVVGQFTYNEDGSVNVVHPTTTTIEPIVDPEITTTIEPVLEETTTTTTEQP